jgi:hypothetical protein
MVIVVYGIKYNNEDIHSNNSSIGSYKCFKNTEIEFNVIGDDFKFEGTFTVGFPVKSFEEAREMIREKLMGKDSSRHYIEKFL